MILKPEIYTEIERTVEGVLLIIQEDGRVSLSAVQVKALLDWLKEGHGLNLESDWNEGRSSGGE